MRPRGDFGAFAYIGDASLLAFHLPNDESSQGQNARAASSPEQWLRVGRISARASDLVPLLAKTGAQGLLTERGFSMCASNSYQARRTNTHLRHRLQPSALGPNKRAGSH